MFRILIYMKLKSTTWVVSQPNENLLTYHIVTIWSVHSGYPHQEHVPYSPCNASSFTLNPVSFIGLGFGIVSAFINWIPLRIIVNWTNLVQCFHWNNTLTVFSQNPNLMQTFFQRVASGQLEEERALLWRGREKCHLHHHSRDWCQDLRPQTHSGQQWTGWFYFEDHTGHTLWTVHSWICHLQVGNISWLLEDKTLQTSKTIYNYTPNPISHQHANRNHTSPTASNSPHHHTKD